MGNGVGVVAPHNMGCGPRLEVPYGIEYIVPTEGGQVGHRGSTNPLDERLLGDARDYIKRNGIHLQSLQVTAKHEVVGHSEGGEIFVCRQTPAGIEYCL